MSHPRRRIPRITSTRIRCPPLDRSKTPCALGCGFSSRLTAALCGALRTERLNTNDRPPLLQRTLRPPEKAQRENDRAEREIEDDKEVGEMSGRGCNELERVENDDGTVGDLK